MGRRVSRLGCVGFARGRDSLGATEGEHEEQDGADVLADHGDDVL